MKVKHALMLTLVSFVLVGVGTYLYVEKTHISEEDIKTYVTKQNSVESEIIDVTTEQNKEIYTLKSINSDLLFEVHVNTEPLVPVILYSTYEVNLNNKKLQNTLAPFIQDIKELGFVLPEESIKISKDMNEQRATVFQASYQGDISLFGATEETYEDIYQLIEILRESKFENLHLNITGTEDGNVILGDLKRFNSAEEMRHFIADLYMNELSKSSD